MKFNRDFDATKEEYYKNETYSYDDGAASMGMGCGMMNESIPGVVCPPIYECPRETVCHRYITHEVPHIMPCNTRIINHHIYRHTYTPTYSCCEENEVQNVYEKRCC